MKTIKKITLIVMLLLLASLFCVFVGCDKNVGRGEGNGDNSYESFCVTFELGDETFKSYSSTAMGKVERPNDPQRDGYTFLDWYESQEFKQVFNFDCVIDKDTTIYALWEKNPNKIRFEGNGSNLGIMSDIIVESNSPVKLPLNTFVRDGYEFIGWSDIPNGSVKNKDGGWFYMEDGVVTLFACWQPKQYLVLLDNDYGEESNSQIVATYGELLPTMKMPTRIGYVFSGYFSQKDGNGVRYIDASMHGCNEYLLLSGTTLYAHWTLATNTLSFDGNGYTSGGTAYISAASLDEVILPECGFERVGYTFAGWNDCADLSGRNYDVGEKFKMPASDDPVVLYANWLNNKYTIIFDDNCSGEVFESEYYYDVAKELGNNTFDRYGYSFVAWNDKSDGSGSYYQDGQIVLNLSEDPDGEVRLYAIWKPITVLVIFNKSGGKGGTSSANITFGEYFPFIIAPTKEGYEFGGYYAQDGGNGKIYLDSNMSAINTSDLGIDGGEVFAYWISKNNTLMLDPNGGVGNIISIATSTDSVINLQNYGFIKTGYSLIGWNTKANDSGEFYSYDSDYIMAASNSPIKLYAVWAAKWVQAIFHGNENTSGNTSNIFGYCDKEITLPNCGFVKTGYRFIGWSKTKDGSADIMQALSSYMIEPTDDESIVFFAQWEVQYFNITYVLNEGVNSIYNPSRYTYFSGDITLSDPTRKGYEFLGWTEDGAKISSIPSNSTGDKVFVAKWSDPIDYDIIYIKNGGQEIFPNPKTYNVITETFYLNDLTKPNYNFEGWAEGNVVEKGSTGNKTFTALWSGISYSISYDLDDGVNGDGNPGTYMADSDPITLKDPTKLGYTFIGWTCEQMGITNPTKAITIAKNSSGNKTFVAHWTPIQYSIKYVLNGGVNSEDNPHEYNTLDEILLNDPSRMGYNFDGWREGAIIVHGSTGDLTFTAEWSPINYDIYIIVEKTTDAQSQRIKYNIESSDIVISIDPSTEHGYVIEIGEDVDNIVVPNKNGYRLSGWYENDNENDLLLSFEVLSGSMGDKTITAKWELIEYSIEYEVEDDAVFETDIIYTYNIESEAIELQRPTREGYIFKGWVDENGETVEYIPSGSFGNIKLKATWDIIEEK